MKAVIQDWHLPLLTQMPLTQHHPQQPMMGSQPPPMHLTSQPINQMHPSGFSGMSNPAPISTQKPPPMQLGMHPMAMQPTIQSQFEAQQHQQDTVTRKDKLFMVLDKASPEQQRAIFLKINVTVKQQQKLLSMVQQIRLQRQQQAQQQPQMHPVMGQQQVPFSNPGVIGRSQPTMGMVRSQMATQQPQPTSTWFCRMKIFFYCPYQVCTKRYKHLVTTGGWVESKFGFWNSTL